ncbi:MAG: HesA/MoeB/ThiF family protein, partial [Spirochaetales bacterium]|nr:HesA/MoeB/ThiF family protein [Spirochaetales bacterium]
EGQEKLKRAKIVIAGAGGLGSPISLYLAAAGIGTIRLIDHGSAELSNLNRQILHFTTDIERKKVDSAAEKLRKLNPEIQVETVDETISEANVAALVHGFDLIVDAMDNLPTRYTLNKAAIEERIPFFHGAVSGFEGRAMTIVPGKSACLQCIYHGAVTAGGKFPVIGTAPAVIGSIQATEVIKYIVGTGELLLNRLLVYDGLSSTFTEFEVTRDPECEHCKHLKQEEK